MSAAASSALGRRRLLAASIFVVVASANVARGNESADAMPQLRESMARFAQPVRVGDLAGRYLLAPSEAQQVLGIVARVPVLRAADGTLLLVVNRGGILGLGTTRVTVPMDDVAVLGEHVALIGLTPAALAALPAARTNDDAPLPPDTRIRAAIVGPFH